MFFYIRLSALMSTKLRDNNPNIADLSDQFRPTKLAEMFSELYDNEWTDAFTAVNGVLTERQTITFLLDILMDAYSFCSQELDNSWRTVSDWYLDDSLPNEQQIKKLLKDSRKVVVVRMTKRITKRYKGNLESVCYIQTLHATLSTEVLVKYVMQSVKLCLLMCANDPPVVISCPDRTSTEPANNIQHDAADIASGKVEQSTAVISPTETQFVQETLERKQQDFQNNLEDKINEEQFNNEEHSIYAENNGADNEQIIRGELKADSIQTSHVVLDIEGSSVEHGYFNRLLFDRNMFKEYTTRGPYLEYIVWPVIYLHRGGPMLGKGVAQGTRGDVGRLEEEQWTWKKDY
ncbi:hypothetical protein DPMN_134782 [Dreissena polymorpha]|uniref:Mitochondria-eating protein C-terminal domain-containing protein n=1 Tax=Dreissena polymorpha TaxID=45954 RepID=A0A9D4G2N6_DREPO|nr:hypothetical protein DPMN_134782 [Dreissena polymorpha]